MSEKVTINHGSGGALTNRMVREVFITRFGIAEPLTDSCLLSADGNAIAYTTDSYVVDPIFFPGGDIGKLAVCGTVNDLAVSGADPLYIAASFIIEEGFPFEHLRKIAGSMAEEAENAGIKIVTGDTKVVEKGKCDKIFITTSGIGIIKPGRENTGSGVLVGAGDKLIINGPLGDHSIAVMGARNKMNFSTPVVSDCASLNGIIGLLLDNSDDIHFMRDITRGGAVTILNELTGMTGMGVVLEEQSIPVDDPVRGLCEIFGFDPLFLANEGKVLFVVGNAGHEKVLDILRSHPLGRRSEVIGEIVRDEKKRVILNTTVGGRRVLDMPSGLQLPRIC
jgi:hydrogenase expression/formation protein HypE